MGSKRGMSLVELMIALSLGAFALTGISYAYLTFARFDKMEQARLAVESLAFEIKSSVIGPKQACYENFRGRNENLSYQRGAEEGGIYLYPSDTSTASKISTKALIKPGSIYGPLTIDKITLVKIRTNILGANKYENDRIEAFNPMELRVKAHVTGIDTESGVLERDIPFPVFSYFDPALNGFSILGCEFLAAFDRDQIPVKCGNDTEWDVGLSACVNKTIQRTLYAPYNVNPVCPAVTPIGGYPLIPARTRYGCQFGTTKPGSVDVLTGIARAYELDVAQPSGWPIVPPLTSTYIMEDSSTQPGLTKVPSLMSESGHCKYHVLFKDKTKYTGAALTAMNAARAAGHCADVTPMSCMLWSQVQCVYKKP